MSGGAVMNAQGQLVGIHGQGETDTKMSEQQGVAVKTGTNQAVPIAYYSQFSSGAAIAAASSQAITADDYLAQASTLLRFPDKAQEIIRLADQSLTIKKTANAYLYRAHAKNYLDDRSGAIKDAGRAIMIDSNFYEAYLARGIAKLESRDIQGAQNDFNRAILINPSNGDGYSNRGLTKSDLGDYQGALSDYNMAIRVNPKNSNAYTNRANAKQKLGDLRGACSDAKKAASLGNRWTKKWLYGEGGTWCRNMP
jgi:tetratricopeptide (TPR) repeat protein